MLNIYGIELHSALLLGTAGYPSPTILQEAVRLSGTQVVTVSLRRESSAAKDGNSFWSIIKSLNVRVLPNTAGCHTVKDAVTTAHMAREVFGTNWIKLEVIGDGDMLQPNVIALVEAARILCADGFEVFPYTTEDLSIAEQLLDDGCKVLMPWGALIGSGRGLNNPYGLGILRAHYPEVPMIIDAGIGLPSHAAAAIEMGFNGVLLNTAVARAKNPVAMAQAFSHAITAGEMSIAAQPPGARDTANPSTPLFGKAIFV